MPSVVKDIALKIIYMSNFIYFNHKNYTFCMNYTLCDHLRKYKLTLEIDFIGKP